MPEDDDLPSVWFSARILAGGRDSDRMSAVLSRLTRADLERFYH